MENLINYILEEKANPNKVIFDACMELDNNEEIYHTYFWPLVKNLVKKHDSGNFEIEKLEQSSSVSKLCQLLLRKVKGSLSGEDRKRFTKFVTGCILKSVGDETENGLSPEEENYMKEWDYNNSDKCNW